jgi:hypothetical protein
MAKAEKPKNKPQMTDKVNVMKAKGHLCAPFKKIIPSKRLDQEK